jgi:hypothetical protein
MKDSYPSVSLERFCWLLGLTRQALYKDTWKGKRKSSKEQLVVSEVKNIRREHPAIGTRKLHELLQSFYQQHSIKMGRDALFCTLSDHRLLIRSILTWLKAGIPHYPNSCGCLTLLMCRVAGNIFT